MKPPLFLFLFLLLLSTATSAVTLAPKATPAPKTNHPAVSPAQSPTSSPTPPTTVTGSKLDPEQVRALQSLNIPTTRDPCIQPSPHNATVCDVSGPYRHLVALRLSNCSTDTSLSSAALKSLSTLRSLSFSDCPVATVHFPSDLALSLTSLSCVRSLRRLSGIWLSRFENLTDLTVSGTPINTRGIFVILGNMKKLTSLTLSHANLTGNLPKYLHQNLTHIDLSDNNLKGTIPTSVTLLESLQSLNLSSNGLNGEMPTGVGNLISLKNLSLASNSFSGSIPDSISSIPGLVHLDLSGNQLNGTVPGFFSKLKSLKVLNLENNQLHGVLPFNASFINRLVVFKVGGNSNLCYNHTVLSSKMKLRIARCDKHGLPVSPPPAKESPSGDSQGDYTDSEADSSSTKGGHHGPNKVVMGVAIALSSIVFLIILLVLMAKCCG